MHRDIYPTNLQDSARQPLLKLPAAEAHQLHLGTNSERFLKRGFAL